ncbi:MULTISPECIES: glycosyl hydrolase [Ruminococcus]|uniref:Glycosyl hydrolase family 26 n=1 Tax=Ruminococcus flavefaciens TaxID=1265 RepID=A0A1M7J9X6_RUMFL|nr:MULTISPECIES: glycosyl hydrolase [Ruminococcus]MCR4793801.1 beta-mannosidase [Ruminococcus sp.]SHM49806.1 Glycosyl hydrolase family 26 [Ruminococcus flavefaciens]
MKSKLRKAIAFAAAGVMAAVQCGSTGLFNVTAAGEATAATAFPYTIEGEKMKGADLWTSIYQTELPGYSGEGFYYLTAQPASFEVTVPEDGMYSIVVHGAQILNKEGRQQAVKINGVKYITQAAYSDKWVDYDFGMVRMNKGVNTIEFISEYGYMAIDTVTVDNAKFPDLSKASGTTVDKDATPETKALMKYLKSVYGKHILSGQQEIYGGGHAVETTIRYDANANKCIDQEGVEYVIDEESWDKTEQGEKFPWHCTGPDGQVYTYSTQNRNYTYNDYNYEVRYIKELTGEEPAIRGFDFGSYCPCYAWDDGVAQRMIDWAKNKNGICTASWHVNVPKTKASYTLGEPLDFGLTTYTENTDFVTANCMVKGTMEYDYFQLCMKNLAAELKKLQDAGVPVIFRPFHEAEGNPSRTDDPIDGSGAWFWWSKEGAVVYNKLWNFLQDTLTNEYGLHNLIWEQNLYAWSDNSAKWYSGDDKVDIVGFDKYNCQYNRHDGKQQGVPNEDAEAGIFYTLNKFVNGNKMVSMPENDSCPSLNNMQVEHAYWLYFCPWYDSEQAHFLCGKEYQDPDTFKELYKSDFCITLSELPKDLYKGGSEPSTGTTTTTTTTKPVTTTTTSSTPAVAAKKYGDANCDGEIDMSDVVLIMQSLANPDKFGLKGSDKNHITAQGEANGDVDKSSAGITSNDALRIQEFLLGKVKDLKPSTK